MKQKLKKLIRKVGTSKSGWGKLIASNFESSSDTVISSSRKIANVIFRSCSIHVIHSIWRKLFLNPTTVRELFVEQNIERKYERWISSQKPRSHSVRFRQSCPLDECGQNPSTMRGGAELRVRWWHHWDDSWFETWWEMSHEFWGMIKEMKNWRKSEWKALTSTG
jgi:hypothetical protein